MPTAIEWVRNPGGGQGETWNPFSGCAVVSSGCTNCYAQRLAGTRLAHLPLYAGTTTPSKAGPVFNGRLTVAPDDHPVWTAPLRRRKPTGYFVGDMADLFHEDRPDAVIDRVFAVMALCPQHRFFVLTKRSARMRKYFAALSINAERDRANNLPAQWQIRLAGANPPGSLPITQNDVGRWLGLYMKFSFDPPTPPWPLPNVWCGASAEDQRRYDERRESLKETPAAVRFWSLEPLLGPIDCGDLTGIDWVIVGSESGPGARPCDLDWVRSIRDQCQAAGAPFFWKQHVVEGRKIGLPALDGVLHDAIPGEG